MVRYKGNYQAVIMLMSLQISHGEYTLFSANIFVGLPAPTVLKDRQFIADDIIQSSIFTLYIIEH